MLFPITCVDNFYSNPDKIREFALSLDYGKADKSNYPGVRTQLLHKIDPVFFDMFCKKIFSLFFDLNLHTFEWEVQTSFQKIYKYDSPEEYFNEVNSGWTHLDVEQILAGVIYLNPSPNLDSGTSFYKPHNIPLKFGNEVWKPRNDFYRENGLPTDQYAKLKSEHNSKFYKVGEFKNVYNRLVSYDTQYWHRESGFSMDNDDFRLTQVFFVNKIDCAANTVPPILRSKQYEFYPS